jgi:hypothetical protein
MHAFGSPHAAEPENDPELCQIGESEQAGPVAGFRDPLSKLAQLAKNAFIGRAESIGDEDPRSAICLR